MTRFANPFNGAFVQRNLSGHKLLGLAAAGLLYLICLSGTATVFYLDLQRWENPQAPEMPQATAQAVAAAVADARTAWKAGDTLDVAIPTPENPRLVVGVGETHRAYDAQGRYAGPADHRLGEALGELHYYLHLPATVGLVLVGLGGVLLLGLILGGILAHPRLFKDAFLWRWRGGSRLARTDLHNRIGVWAAPFHLVIAFTGAAIGLIEVLLLVMALGFHHGDAVKAAAPLFGPAPVSVRQGVMTSDAIVKALHAVVAAYPGAEPDYLAFNNPGTARESLTVYADLPSRLTYGETFEFDGKGVLAATHHITDGPLGRQIYASLYKLHFGSFGGVWVRWAYVLLGLGLCLICTTGMDIWFLKAAQRGQPRPRLHRLWMGFVWGAPVALALASAACLAGLAFRPVFWSLLPVLALGALAAGPPRMISRLGRGALGLALIGLVATHVAVFAGAAFSAAAWAPNLAFGVLGTMLCLSLLRGHGDAAGQRP
jgi:uncharacterized iron-regulated membrane protein